MKRLLPILLSVWAAAAVAPLAVAQGTGDVGYLPLSEDNTWIYRTPGFPQQVIIRPEPVVIHDTLYFVASFVGLPVDTLRVADDGSVYGRWRGRDVLLLDVHAPASSTYSFPFEPDGSAYDVTVTRDRSVEVAAGSFDDCISFTFDSPMAIDEELHVILAPGVGVVAAATAWADQELWLAEIGDVHVPPLDATIPDTLDWRGYFPLEVGNVWEYRYESLFEAGYFEWEIVGDSIAGARSGFVAVIRHFDDVLNLIHERRQFWFDDDERRAAITYQTGECDFSVPFPVPQHQGVRLEDGFCGRYWLHGGYTDEALVLGTDTLHYPAWKWFENVAGGFTVYHGIGVPGWSVGGLRDSSHLIYTRLGGVEYGESMVLTSTEEPAPRPEPEMKVDLYPNPFPDRFTVEVSGPPALPLKFEVIDVLGRRMLGGTLKTPSTTVDASSLSSGAYFLRITDGSRVLTTQAIVKATAP